MIVQEVLRGVLAAPSLLDRAEETAERMVARRDRQVRVERVQREETQEQAGILGVEEVDRAISGQERGAHRWSILMQP